ncbi:hypothetical protein ABN763_12050 [Spongiivirga sp. MCCC 1A20706]|uniref:hypothetical protein n=1 Tax=Spongiivirga sp. MCCC 1A20706 TaxID=3160963 RepID=UPI003977D1B8
MKTSVILIALIIVNTSALLSEIVASLVSRIPIWLLISVEVLLIIGFYLNYLLKDVRNQCEISFNDIDLYNIKSAKK